MKISNCDWFSHTTLAYTISFVFEEVDSIAESENTKKSFADVGLLKNLERALHNETLLREISYLIVSDMPLQEIAQNISKQLCQYLKVDRCLIHDFRRGNTSYQPLNIDIIVLQYFEQFLAKACQKQ